MSKILNINKFHTSSFIENLKTLVIISDFDFTLTHRFSPSHSDSSKRLMGSFGVIENYSKFPKGMKKKSEELYTYYSPKELDLSLSIEERKRMMNDWTRKELELLIETKVKKEDYANAVNEHILMNNIKLRKKAKLLFDIVLQNRIPFYIISAGNGDVIIEFLKKEIGEELICLLLKENLLFLISNFGVFDEKTQHQTSYKKPILNTFNKVDALQAGFNHNGSHAFVFGDHHHDSLCISKLNLSKAYSIAYLNYDYDYMLKKQQDLLDRYRLHWDCIVFNEESFEYGVDLIEDVVRKIKK